MAKIEFDLLMLKKLGDIDAPSALDNFQGYDEYFNALYRFAGESKDYLREYDPTMVADDVSEFANFIKDVKKIRSHLLSLGITQPIAMLSDMCESPTPSINSIKKWLENFHIEMEKMARCISDSAIVVPIVQELSQNTVPPPLPGREKPLILAVDDKPELLTTVVHMLNERYKVMAATSGPAVLKLIQKHKPVLFLLDIEMPGMNGYELSGQIRKYNAYATTPIIFLTSKNTRDNVISAIVNGGNDYILKPVQKDILLRKIYQHIGV